MPLSETRIMRMGRIARMAIGDNLNMKCVICKHGETELGKVTVTLERDALTLVVKNVPAQVCRNCGEEYLYEATTENLLRNAEEDAQSGVQVKVRQYLSA